MKNKNIAYCIVLCCAMIEVVSASVHSDELRELAQKYLNSRLFSVFQNKKQPVEKALLQVRNDLMGKSLLDIKSFDISQPAFHFIAGCQKNNIKVLPEEFDINSRYFYGDTLLTKAAYWGNIRKVITLINLGADVNALGEVDKRHPWLCGDHFSPKIVRTPLIASVIPAYRKSRYTTDCIEKSRVVEILCKAGANVHAKDSAGLTALDRLNKNCCCNLEPLTVLDYVNNPQCCSQDQKESRLVLKRHGAV